MLLIAVGWIVTAYGIVVNVRVSLVDGETLLQEKNFTGCRWDLNPGPYRQLGHCWKHAEPFHHLELIVGETDIQPAIV